MSNASTPEKRRRRKRAQILTRLDTLKDEPASLRTRTMNKEFGPYWYLQLDATTAFPEIRRKSNRYLEWEAEKNRENSKKNNQAEKNRENAKKNNEVRSFKAERLALWKSLSTSPK